jgi:hypothetical protein
MKPPNSQRDLKDLLDPFLDQIWLKISVSIQDAILITPLIQVARQIQPTIIIIVPMRPTQL